MSMPSWYSHSMNTKSNRKGRVYCPHETKALQQLVFVAHKPCGNNLAFEKHEPIRHPKSDDVGKSHGCRELMFARLLSISADLGFLISLTNEGRLVCSLLCMHQDLL